MPCVFRMLSGPYKGKVFPVDTRRHLTVGNALEADFTIPDGKLEPFHCDVLFDSGRNGRMARIRARTADALLVVDGVPMDEALLQSGERMKIGSSVLEFLEGGHPDDPVAGHLADPGGRCAACKRAIPHLGGGRRLLNLGFCWRCIDLRLTVSRELGRYRILRKIDRGVAEIAYAAEDLATKECERVALHVLKAERQRDERVLKRFLTKAVFAYSLDHPAFARTRDLIHRPDVTSYVTDLCERPTLQERLLAGRPLDLATALRATRDLADALGYARDKGMMAGRLKPARVLVSDEGEVRIKDYWLSPELEERAARGIGAPKVARPAPLSPTDQSPDGPGGATDVLRYLVPTEKEAEHFADESKDIRPLGILLFQMATAAQPPEATVGEIVEALARAHHGTRAAPAPESAPPLPPIITKLVRGMFAREARLRYRTLAEVAADLEAAAASL